MEDDGEFGLAAGQGVISVERRKILLYRPHDNEIVIYNARSMLAAAGFDSTDEFIVASAASELATNILRFAGRGELEISIIRDSKGNPGIELFACDRGPGISDIEKAMQDQYSTFPGSLGLGLPSVERIMDEFNIESYPGKGTRVLARKWRIHGRS
jgi:serine/threonine-protein kinase RsbT